MILQGIIHVAKKFEETEIGNVIIQTRYAKTLTSFKRKFLSKKDPSKF